MEDKLTSALHILSMKQPAVFILVYSYKCDLLLEKKFYRNIPCIRRRYFSNIRER